MSNKFSEDGIIYKVSQNKEATVCGFTNSNQKKIDIPHEIRDCPVVAIGPKAFYNSSIRAIILPNSIIHIDQSAFEGCANLVSVMQMGLQSTRAIVINAYAFRNCQNLKVFDLRHDMLIMGREVFYNCEKIVLLPKIYAASIIGKNTFYNCKTLCSLHFFGDGTLTVDEDSLQGCVGLTCVTFGCKVKMTDYLMFVLKDISISTRSKYSNIVELAYNGYKIKIIDETNHR